MSDAQPCPGPLLPVGLAHSSPLPSVHSSTVIGERILWDLGKVYSSLPLQQPRLDHQEALRLTLEPAWSKLDPTRRCTVLSFIHPGPHRSQDPPFLPHPHTKVVQFLPLSECPLAPWTGLQRSPSGGTGVSGRTSGSPVAGTASAFSGCSVYLPSPPTPSFLSSVTRGQDIHPTCRHHLFLPGPTAQRNHSTSWVGLKSPVHMSRPHVWELLGGLGSDLK